MTAIEKYAAAQQARDVKMDAALVAIQASLAAVVADIAGLKAKIALLEGGTPPPPVDDAAILAELTDSSIAGMDKRLGPAGDATAQFPDVWTRAEVPVADMGFEDGPTDLGTYSQGLAIQAPPVTPPTPRPKFDFGGTEVHVIAAGDAPLIVNPDNPGATVSDGGPGPTGVEVYRQRTEEHKGGMVRLLPRTGPDAAGNDFPDNQFVNGHTASYGMGNKLGRPIDAARARINRRDGGGVLYDGARGGQAYVGTVGSQTAFPPWSGEQLDPDFIPICLAVSSQNEFYVVCGHNKVTKRGQMIWIVNWGGQEVDGKKFPFDFRDPMPGLVQSGVVTGMKIIRTIDLPIKWPTSISIATSRNTSSNRIEGPSGNAAYLSEWPLDTQADRDAFMGKNQGWIATWGKIVVASKSEGKVVQLDATALYQGYRDQYFTTQAKYDATRPQHSGVSWWLVYETTNQAVWPNMPDAWVPTVTRVIDVARPTVAWMLETNLGASVIGSEDGMLRWFKDDGTADGSLQLGPNITSIKDGKYDNGVAKGDLVVTSRGARTVYGIHDKQINYLVQDEKLLDPVDAEEGDTHGIETRFLSILSFTDKKLWSHRNTKLVFATQGGVTFGTGPTAEADKLAADEAVKNGETPLPPVESLECTGSTDTPEHPFKLAGTNVN